MSKSNRLMAVVFALLLAIYHIVVFGIPIPREYSFWIAYGFSMAAFVVLIVSWFRTIHSQTSLKSLFLGYPILYIAFGYFVVQLLLCALFMAVPSLPRWIAPFTCAILLCLCFIMLVTAEVGRDEIERVGAKVRERVQFLQTFRGSVDSLSAENLPEEIQNALKKFSEELRYSDPMSDVKIAEVESQMTTERETLADELSNSRWEEAKARIANLRRLLEERNRRCLAAK